MSRRRMLSAFKGGAEVGNYEDLAVLPIDVDPQVLLSRNWLVQPFYNIFDKDTVLTQMSGAGRVRMRESSVNTFDLSIGDHVYVPAGTPTRYEPFEESVVLRYLAADTELEAAAWYCEKCGGELHYLEWQHDHEAVMAAAYANACALFSENSDARTCRTCGTCAPEIDLEQFGWASYVRSASDLVSAPEG